jgi:hypothetical protein
MLLGLNFNPKPKLLTSYAFTFTRFISLLSPSLFPLTPTTATTQHHTAQHKEKE